MNTIYLLKYKNLYLQKNSNIQNLIFVEDIENAIIFIDLEKAKLFLDHYQFLEIVPFYKSKHFLKIINTNFEELEKFWKDI